MTRVALSMLALLAFTAASCYRETMTCAEVGGHESLERFLPMLAPGPVLVPITTCEVE